MAVPKVNPLDQFKKLTDAEAIRINPMPRLHDAVKTNGLMDGLLRHAEEMEQWRIETEKSINDRFASIQPVTPVNTPVTTSKTA